MEEKLNDYSTDTRLEDVKKHLIESNNYLEQSLVDGFINEKILSLLPMEVIEYCAINKNAQQKIMDLSDNNLIILSKIIKYSLKNNQDWIVPSAAFIHNVENDNYKELFNDTDLYGLDDKLIENFIFLTNNYGNFYGIKSYNDIKKISEIREERLNTFSETKDPNIILLIKYGISYDTAYSYYKRYGKDVNNFEESVEKDFLIDISNIIHGKGTDNRICNDFNLMNNIDSRLRNYFANIYNKELYKVSNDKYLGKIKYNDNEIKVYDAGVNFTMCIYSYGLATEMDKPTNFKKSWEKPSISNDYFCSSIISDLNMRTSIKHCVFGFDNLENNDIALLAPNDLGTGGIYNDVNVTNKYHNNKLIADVEFRIPSEMINNTRFTNNEVYRKRRRYNNDKGERLSPNYIVYFKETTDKEINDDRIWKESVQAANDFNIPIVVVDCEKCLKNNISKIDKILDKYQSRYDDTDSIKTIIERIYSLRSGYHIAPKLLEEYLSREKLMSYFGSIVNHINDISKLSPNIATKNIDTLLLSLDDEYKKVLKSPHWVEYARKQGYKIEKPNDVVASLKKLKQNIELNQMLDDNCNKQESNMKVNSETKNGRV